MFETLLAYPVFLVLVAWLALLHVIAIASFGVTLTTLASRQLRVRVAHLVATCREFRKEFRRWREL